MHTAISTVSGKPDPVKNSFIKFNNSFNMGILETAQPTKDSGNSQGADYSEGNSTQYEFLEIIGYG